MTTIPWRLTVLLVALTLFGAACSDDSAASDSGNKDGLRADGPRADGPLGDGPRGDGPRADGPLGDSALGDGPRADGPARDIAVVDATAAVCPPTAPFGTNKGQKLPNLTLQDCAGTTYKIHDLCGKKAAWIFIFRGS